jgi:hypothetical protein
MGILSSKLKIKLVSLVWGWLSIKIISWSVMDVTSTTNFMAMAVSSKILSDMKACSKMAF